MARIRCHLLERMASLRMPPGSAFPSKEEITALRHSDTVPRFCGKAMSCHTRMQRTAAIRIATNCSVPL